jgi:hypothetical protein
MIFMSAVEHYSGCRQLCVHAQPCMQGSGDAVFLLCMIGAVNCIQKEGDTSSRGIVSKACHGAGTAATCCDPKFGSSYDIRGNVAYTSSKA